MSVHYKFKSALEYDTITFDGLHISVKDLKNAIIQQKRIGKNTDFDLQVTNAQTKEVYEDENALIPKNTSLLIARIPTTTPVKSKVWEGYGGDVTPPSKIDEVGPIAKATDLSSLDAPEDDKIKAMMSQSTQDYDPSNYQKIRGANQVGAVPPTYRCYKCHQTGHWIKDCALGQGQEATEIKKSTGIPRSFMVPVEGPQVPGAMMTPNGSYAVPVLDHEAYNTKPAAPAPVQDVKVEIPEDLVCSICSDLLTDAVMIPCCGNSFCDECIRSTLLESEDHECPDCHEKDISPGTLIPNRFLRNSVLNFKNTSGYVKKESYKQRQVIKPILDGKDKVDVKADPGYVKNEKEEKPVISEADSTEPTKNQEYEQESSKSTSESEHIAEGPPGVSPKASPQSRPISKRIISSRHEGSKRHRSRERSPKRHPHKRKSPNYSDSSHNEERPGTPTVDEPGRTNYSSYSNPVPGTMSMMNMPPIQGPPPNIATTYPSSQAVPPFGGQGIPPNFRIPPPGALPPYMPPGTYGGPPRPLYDSGRPPVAGSNTYSSNYSGARREYDRRMRNRTPPGVIDDPLAAFNKMLREKDERERRAKQRYRRHYSRSRSRSFSPRSPRRRSRSPRRRSRSRSFSLSRSRSRSYSGSLRGSPYRDYSPRHSPKRGPPPPRYRSPLRSPRRYADKNDHLRDRDLHDRDRNVDRDYKRDEGYREKRGRSAEKDRYYDNYSDRNRDRPWPSRNDNYFPPMDGSQQVTYNRFPDRDYNPYVNKNPLPMTMHPPPSRFDDVAPPGVEEPPVPGLENSPKIDRPELYADHQNHSPNEKEADLDVHKSGRDSENRRTTKVDEKKRSHTTERKREKSHEKRSYHSHRTKTTERKSSSPHKTTKSKESPLKERKKRRDSSSDKDKKEKKKVSEDERKKSKDKKKKREKEKSDRKKRKERKEKHKKEEKKHKEDINNVPVDESEKRDIVSKSPKEAEYEEATETNKSQTLGLYDDILEEGVDVNAMKEYTEFKESNSEDIKSPTPETQKLDDTIEEGELEISKESEDSEKDILEIHSNDIDLKTELDNKNEVLAPLPEKSKWEIDEDLAQLSPSDSKSENKFDKYGKVTTEVIKRAENAIFAKAINAIRPIEIKKISSDRAKLYSGERGEDELKKIHVTIASSVEKKSEPAPPHKLPIKERLGIKIEDDKNTRASRSPSPFTRRLGERSYNHYNRRIDSDRRRNDNRDRRRDGFSSRREDKREYEPKRREDNRSGRRSKSKTETRTSEKRRRSRSRSNSVDQKDKTKKKAKGIKKERSKRDEKPSQEDSQKPKVATDKRKPTLDEANFEPDYNEHSDSDKDEGRKEAAAKDSSSSDSSDSSSGEERKRKKHRKHRKKKSRKDSSSSDSESESDSSEDEKEKKRKKHKKKQKKKRKVKHK